MKAMPNGTLVAQGVFPEQADGALRFAPAPAPTDLEIARLLASVRRRIVRLVLRHGIDLEQPSNEAEAADERLFDCPVYARIVVVPVLVVVRRSTRTSTTPRGSERRRRMATTSVEDLEVFKLAHTLVLKVYEVTRTFPREETFGLVSQLRRAAGLGGREPGRGCWETESSRVSTVCGNRQGFSG